jgi:hypothetical protein
MSTLPNTIASGFILSFRDLAGRVGALSQNLSEDQFWTKPYPYGNSFGHLVLHLIGNLNYYIGAQIGNTGYVRDRDREFTDSTRPPKQEVLRALNEAVNIVIATLEAQTADSWSKEYEAVGVADIVKDRFAIVLRCATHFQHHLGQMIYLEKELSK